MKTIVTLLVALLLVCPAWAQSPLKLARTTHNFGTIYEQHGPVTAHFAVYNAADTAVRMASIVAGCGCTVPERAAEAIAAADSSHFTVTYNPAGRPGPFSKTVTYTLAGPDSIQGTVTIRGEVVPHPYPVAAAGLRFTSTTFDFGRLWHHQTDTAWLGIMNEGSQAATVTLPAKLMAGLRPVQATTHLAPGQADSLGVVWAVPQSGHWGFAFEHAEATVRHPGQPIEALRLNLTAMVNEDFSRTSATESQPRASVDHAVLELSNIVAGSTHTAYAQLQNTGNAPLLIRHLKTSCTCLQAIPQNMTVAPGGRIPIELVYAPAKKVQGQQALSVQIIVNDPDQPTLRLALKAKVAAPTSGTP